MVKPNGCRIEKREVILGRTFGKTVAQLRRSEIFIADGTKKTGQLPRSDI